MKPRQSSKPDEPDQPGAFMPDGSFNEDAGWSQQGPVDALVRSLGRQRRGMLTVAQAVAHIRSTGLLDPFPSLEQWEGCTVWYACWAQTAAEEAIKRSGRGTDGHWCGDRWALGPEKDCREEGHRSKKMDAKRLTEMLLDSMEDRT